MLATVNEPSTKGLMLKTGTVVDATIVAAPSSTKNASGQRDPEMHQTKKGNQWHFGMKAHIGVPIPISGWCTPCEARLGTCMTSLRATACCTARRLTSRGCPATRGQPSGLMPARSQLAHRHDWANARRWTRLTVQA